MFIDSVAIRIKAGSGGNGAISFHREKYVPAGGPDGGDGGAGGDVVFCVDDHLSTLLDFRYKKKYEAESGAPGMSSNKTGKSGKDLIIRVPRGTLLREVQSGMLLHDLSSDQPFVAARGGKGGAGNARFATATRQAPRFAKNGLPGEEAEVLLELKLLADVGVVGFPNAGKSTLLSAMSAARPKVANYPFTTLIPQLGVVRIDEGASFVMADIPGLIEGASDGLGLGHGFLRHVERCRLLVHLVDTSGSEGRIPVEDFLTINRELVRFSNALAELPQIVVGNKMDLNPDPALIDALRTCAQQQNSQFVAVSAVTREGLDVLLAAISRELEHLPPIRTYEQEVTLTKPKADGSETVISVDEDTYIVEGDWILRLLGGINFSDYESLNYLHRILRDRGVYDLLREEGIETGDTVSLYGMEFEYVD